MNLIDRYTYRNFVKSSICKVYDTLEYGFNHPFSSWKGYFEDSLPAWAQTHDQLISFIHIDCDLNSSTKTIFEILADRVNTGTVLLFDDYFNFPGWEQDGHAVFTQFAEKFGWEVSYLGYAYKELAVIIV